MKGYINKEPFFTADESQAKALLEFTSRARSADLSGPRLLLLQGAPASGMTRIIRAIPDELDRHTEGRDMQESPFEGWGEQFEIVNFDRLKFEDVEEFEGVLLKATLPASEGGNVFAIVAGREFTLKPAVEAAALRVTLLSPAVAEA